MMSVTDALSVMSVTYALSAIGVMDGRTFVRGLRGDYKCEVDDCAQEALRHLADHMRRCVTAKDLMHDGFGPTE